MVLNLSKCIQTTAEFHNFTGFASSVKFLTSDKNNNFLTSDKNNNDTFFFSQIRNPRYQLYSSFYLNSSFISEEYS